MRRTRSPVALAAALLATGWLTAGARWPAQQAQDQRPEITVYKSPT